MGDGAEPMPPDQVRSIGGLDRIEKYSVALINLAGVSVLLCAGLSRFVFPLISLEGRKFWILGLLPGGSSGLD